MPPPRSGDWNSVNRFLTAGGTVEGIPRENPYREYYLSLHKKNMKAYCEKQDGTYKWVEMGEPVCGDFCDTCGDCLHCYNEYCEGGCFWVIYKDDEKNPFTNPCGKPHNNGEDTCNECLTIKEGI